MIAPEVMGGIVEIKADIYFDLSDFSIHKEEANPAKPENTDKPEEITWWGPELPVFATNSEAIKEEMAAEIPSNEESLKLAQSQIEGNKLKQSKKRLGKNLLLNIELNLSEWFLLDKTNNDLTGVNLRKISLKS